MGWRFRRSIKIAPGVRLSFGKKSASVRIGGRGFGVTKSTTGRTTVSSGIPGTGLYYRETITPAKRVSPVKRARPASPAHGMAADQAVTAMGGRPPEPRTVEDPHVAGNPMRWIVDHRVGYYLCAIAVALVLPSIHPVLVLVSLGVLIGMVPLRRRARSNHPSSLAPVGPTPVTGGSTPLAGVSAGLERATQAAPVVSAAPGGDWQGEGELAALPVPQDGERVNVVGTRYHDGIRSLVPGGVPAVLRREPDNPHDHHAIAVWAGRPLAMTGYLPASIAAWYAPRMDAAARPSMPVAAELYPSFGPDEPANLAVYLAPLPAPGPGEPVATSWTGIEAWGARTRQCRVATDSLGEDELLNVFWAQGEDVALWGQSLRGVDCVAVRSREGVGILVDGYLIGMLAPGDGSAYAPVLSRLPEEDQGINGSVDLWVVPGDMDRSVVTVRLPQPDRIDPPASVPAAPHVILPRKSKIQVSGEEEYLAELSGLLGTAAEVDVAATLHECESVSGRGKPYVEVRINDRRVGRLTPTMSEHMLPIVRACAAENLLVVCKAMVQGNQLKADVVLDTTKSGDLSSEWITTHVRAPGSEGAAGR